MLIHCICGVSRSVTIMMVYLIKRKKKTVIEALEIIRKKRSIANPNEYFMYQLLLYYNQNNDNK